MEKKVDEENLFQLDPEYSRQVSIIFRAEVFIFCFFFFFLIHLRVFYVLYTISNRVLKMYVKFFT